MQPTVCKPRCKKVESRVSGRAFLKVNLVYYRAPVSCRRDKLSKPPLTLTDHTPEHQTPQPAVREPARVRHGARAGEQQVDQDSEE